MAESGGFSGETGARALDFLADEPRWVAWLNEERDGKPTKVPFSPVRPGRAAVDDASTWGIRSQAEQCAAKLVNGAGGGIGVVLGPLGDKVLAGLDLDSCIDADGNLATWAQTIVASIPSYTEKSPSLRGVKVFFRCNGAESRVFLDLLGVDSGKFGTRRSVAGENGADHGPAVEVYIGKRYFATTSHRWADQPDDIALIDRQALEQLAQAVLAVWGEPTGSEEGAQAKGQGPKDDSRSGDAMAIGAAIWRAGKSFDDMVLALRDDPATASWYREKAERNNRHELKNIWKKAFDDASDEELLSRLDKLTELAYGKERIAAAKKLNCPLSFLDSIIKGRRKSTAAGDKKQGRPITMSETIPWPEAIDGNDLINALVETIRRYVILDRQAAVAVALWVVASYRFNSFFVFPRLFITAPEKECGKSTLLSVIEYLSNKPLIASHATAPALFRTIEQYRPTVLLDEADAYMRNNEDLRTVVDAGHRKDGNMLRCAGDDFEPRAYSCWAPLVIAAIGHLPGTIESRSIIIRLERKLINESIEPLSHNGAKSLFTELAQKIARWITDNGSELPDNPMMPKRLINRGADNWRPLFAVAERMGEKCLQTIVESVTSLERGSGESARILLLRDIRSLFEKKAVDVLFTEEIILALTENDDRPWAEWNKGEPINSHGIAKLLRQFGIQTNQTVRRGKKTAKGYRREWFADAFERYLPKGTSRTIEGEELDEWLNATREAL